MKKTLLISALLFLVCDLYSQNNLLPAWIPTDGLYGYWPLNGNINDLSGNENHGTTDGNYSSDTHENGEQSVYLQNQLIVLPTTSDLNIDNFTVQFWTKAVSYNIHNKVQIADPSGPWRWAINWADSISPLYGGDFLYYIPGECNGSYAESGNNIDNLVSIDRDVWHLLTVVVEGQQTSFYKDGNLITVSNESSNLTCFNDNMNIYFGGDIPGAIEYYNGWFDNIAIWTRALNSEEIETIHYSTTSGCDYQGNFLDQDGNQNQYINYGSLDWSVSEVNVTTYRDGTPIPLVVDESEWGSQSTGAYCYINNDPNNNILYNYYAIIGKHDNDPNTPNKNLAPEGWRMPSDADWNNLDEFISNSDYVSDGNVAMAMASTSGWTNSSNQGAPGFMQSENNSSCFNAYPNGTRGVGAGFNQQGETSEFWSTDELTHYINFAINTFINTNNNAGNGKSARFVRDFEDNCTSDGTFIDQENHIYDYINYGTQSWSVLNATTEIYRDGTPIPQVTNLSDWVNLTTGAWTYFENDPTKGKLYNWYAVAGIHDNDPTTPNKEFAPDGWRVPNIDDWDILQNYLVESGFNYDGSLTGNKIGKSMASKSGWIISENTGDTGNQQNLNNSSCFNAIPYGMVSDSYNFINEGSSAIFWTSENLNSSSSYYRDINSNANSLGAGSDFNPPSGLTIASNRGCSVRLVKDLGCTATTPIGSLNQSFCDSATVEDLSVDGNNIQWYDAPTAGNLLDSSTALIDNQTVYASQTVGGCESVERLEVIVGIQNIQISSTATEVCDGESVNLSVEALGTTFQNNFCSIDEIPMTLHQSLLGAWPFCGNASDISGNNFNGTLNGGVTPGVNRFGEDNNSYIFDGQPLTYISMGTHELLDITQGSISISAWVNTNNVGGTKTILSKANTDTSNVFGSYTLHLNGPANFIVTNSTSANSYYSVLSAQGLAAEEWKHLTAVADIDELKLRLYFDGLMVSEIDWEGTYKGGVQEFLIGSHYKSDFALNYMYNFNGSIDDVAIWNRVLNQYEIDYLSMSNSTNYLWSTGDISENISVTPSETTEYWVDVTTDGITCREYITINVTAPVSPTGDIEQTFCDSATVADLIASGDNIQWYDTATGGNLLSSTTPLTDGQVVYASSFISGDIYLDFNNWNNESNGGLGNEPSDDPNGNFENYALISTPSGLWDDYQENYLAKHLLESNVYLETVSGYDYLGTNNSSYYYKSQNLSGWNEANNTANLSGGWLATIQSQTESDFVSELMSEFTFDLVWIGLYQDVEDDNYTEPDGAWKWLNFNQCEGPRLAVTVSIQEITITASATEVCAGEEVTLNVNNLNSGPTSSCHGYTNQIFSDWTELAPNAEYVNIIKHNNIYYLRSNNDVLQSDNINGSWVSMNFQNQIGYQSSPIATLFDFDWADRLQVATLHNSLYAYENGTWVNNGLSGYGCSGRALTRLANNRIIVSKWGYLRDLYISDDNGVNWTNVTNVDNDYRDIIVADNGTVFACGGSNTASMTGLIKSTDNGNSFFNISSELGINYASTLSDDCEGNLYVLADNSIYKSIDEGENWTLHSNTPFSSTVGYSFLLPISSEVLFLFGRNSNEVGLYESNDGGLTWQELTNPLSDLNTIREFKLIDNVLVILSDEGVFGKTIEFNTTTYLWSTGDTTANISVTPTETTEYWVDVTTNGITCREYITINVTAPPAPTGNAVGEACSDLTVGTNNNSFNGENILWYDSINSQTPLSDDTLLVDGTTYYISQTVDGCESIDRFEILILAPLPTITIDNPIICEGESTTVSVSTNPFLGTVTYLWNSDENETSDFIITAPTESGGGWVDVSLSYEYEGGIVQNLCRYFYSITVQDAPEPPVSGGDISECETIAAQNITASATVESGSNIIWYDAAVDGNVITDPSLSTPGNVIFYAEAISQASGCTSLLRTPVTLTITSITPPTGDNIQSFCNIITTSDLNISGSDILWYDSITGSNLVDPSTALLDGQTLFASQTQDGCESIFRLEVNIEIDIIPNPILINNNLEFCIEAQATLADIQIDSQGFILEWYDSSSSGSLLPLDDLLEDNNSYYATLYDPDSGCESIIPLQIIPSVFPCEVIIYNALSLNNNGINDYMVIENVEYFPENSLEVFNRDGHLIYYQKQYGVGDNLFKGVANVNGIYGRNSNGNKKLPTGSYLYVFNYFNQFDQQQYTLKGFLTINSN